MVEALILTRAFGVKHFATILGAVVVVETIGQILSPTIAGAIYDATGSYDLALFMFMGTFATAAVMFFVASRMKRPYEPGASRHAPVPEVAPVEGVRELGAPQAGGS